MRAALLCGRPPQKYSGLTGVEVKTGKEAVALNAEKKEVTVRDTASGEEEVCPYDKLVIAVGASPAELPIEGKDLPGVFRMRTPDDAEGIRAYAEENKVRKAVVIGAGFIGPRSDRNERAGDPGYRSGDGREDVSGNTSL